MQLTGLRKAFSPPLVVLSKSIQQSLAAVMEVAPERPASAPRPRLSFALPSLLCRTAQPATHAARRVTNRPIAGTTDALSSAASSRTVIRVCACCGDDTTTIPAPTVIAAIASCSLRVTGSPKIFHASSALAGTASVETAVITGSEASSTAHSCSSWPTHQPAIDASHFQPLLHCLSEPV